MSSELLKDLKEVGIEFKTSSHKGVGFHGTSRRIAERILSSGFDMGEARPDRRYGAAIYFFDDKPYDGYEFALCFARHFNRIADPFVLVAELNFARIIDLTKRHNHEQYWALLRYLKGLTDDNEFDEKFVGYFIGTRVADGLGCDGIGSDFPLQEPKNHPGHNSKRQRGYAARKLAAISGVRTHSSK